MRFPVSFKRPRHQSFLPKTRLSLEVKKVFKALVVTLFLFLALSSVIFLLSRGSAAQKGYQLRSAELQHEKLRSEFQEMDKKVLESSSTKTILQSKTVKNMEPAAQPHYLKD